MSGSDKSSHTQTNLKLSAVGLFKYVWPFVTTKY